jgi:hypothetical protein
MKNDKNVLKKLYEVRFQYTTYNRLYIHIDDIGKLENKLRDLNLNLSFRLDEESFDIEINRDLILVNQVNEVEFDELSQSTLEQFKNPFQIKIEESILKDLELKRNLSKEI